MLQSEHFADKFRPTKREHLIGETQLACWDALEKAYNEGKIKNKILFTGDTGTGKTTIALMYIKLLLGLKPKDSIDGIGIHHFNGADKTGVDEYRQGFIDALDRKPMFQQYKIFFIDEIHKLSNSAQNALLTPVENLPDWAIVIVATSEINKVIPALRKGRFHRIDLKAPSAEEFKKKAKKILASVQYSGNVDVKVIDEIIEASQGSIREFDDLMQSFVEGTYQKPQTEEDNQFAFNLISNYKVGTLEQKIKQVFKDAEKEAKGNYTSVAIGLAHYAIGMIAGKPTGQWFNNACYLLECFGDGLSPYGVSEKAAFYVALKRYMEFRK